MLLRTEWWFPAMVSAAALSLVVCILGWPDSRIGVIVNVGVLLLVLVGHKTGNL
jgi:hypothetical protein